MSNLSLTIQESYSGEKPFVVDCDMEFSATSALADGISQALSEDKMLAELMVKGFIVWAFDGGLIHEDDRDYYLNKASNLTENVDDLLDVVSGFPGA